MPFPGEQSFKSSRASWSLPRVEPSQRAVRIQAVEKDVILPLRLLLIAILGYFFFLSDWSDVPDQPRGLGHALFQYYFWVYLAANVAAGALLHRGPSNEPEDHAVDQFHRRHSGCRSS